MTALSPDASADADTDADVLVIGAGAAGIEAARTLTAAGRRVIVLEERDRIGGRLHTDRSSMSVPVEVGHGPEHPWVANDSADYRSFPRGNSRGSRPLPDPGEGEVTSEHLNRLGIAPETLPLALRAIELDAESFTKLPARDIDPILLGLLEGNRVPEAPLPAAGGAGVLGRN